MKKNVIWFVGLVMMVCCVGLLYLQVSYIEAIVNMRREHFKEGVRRSLYQAAYNLELDEMKYYLTKDVQNDIHRTQIKDGYIKLEHSFMFSSSEGDLAIDSKTTVRDLSGTMFKLKNVNRFGTMSIKDAQRISLDILKQRYKYQRSILDEVIYNMLYKASEKPSLMVYVLSSTV